MNQWASGFLRPPDHRTTGGRSSISRRRSSAPAGCTSTTATSAARDGGGFSASIVDLAALRREQPRAAAQRRARRWCSTCRRSRPPRKRRSGTTSSTALEAHLGLPGRHDQGLRAGRADRGVLPADGNPRRARPALRRLQHRALGLHQQRLRRAGLGSGVRQPEHRRDHDDLRLHAALRGPRAPRRQHARSARPVRAVAGRHGAEHPGRVGSRRRARHGARGRRRRARAAGGRQRQVGRPLEDGPHRPAGVGEGGRGQSAAAALSAAHLHAGGRRRPDAARAGAAHDARRPRSAQRRAAVRQRLRPGLPGGGAQAGRLLRQRRRALPDGGHGDRRDPPEHPLGMAAQARARSPRTTRRPASRRASVFTRGAVRAAARRGVRQAARRRQSRRPRRLEGHDAADRARDRRDLRRATS